MTDASIRPAFEPTWPHVNRSLREVVGALTEDQLAIQPTPDRWPLWATVGHLACQRVFGLCVFAGAPGVETTPFPNSAFDCPGDDDLERVWSAEALVGAIDSTFAVIERCLDTWSVGDLTEVISHPDWGEDWTHTRGWAIQRSYAHDVSHCTELNETLGRHGLPQIELWEA